MLRRPVIVVLVTGAAVAVVAVAGTACKDDDVAARVLSRKGEACNVTNDCAEGLACLPIPGGSIGVCTVGEFKVAETAKECLLIECKVQADCCGPKPPSCPALLEQCQTDAGAQSTFACQQYQALCKCADTIACEQNHCVTNCVTNQECAASPRGRICAGGRCAQCAMNSDCPEGQSCLNGICKSPCETDGDCAGFARCITGRCVESGCQTDRECIAATRNVEAKCGTNGRCKVPCQTDLECGSPKDFSFFSCIRNECTYVGCQNDKDCRLLLTGASDASTIGENEHVVCRDRTTPENATKPAN